MDQWLVRGTCIDEQNRIKKMICSGSLWQLYETNNEQNVLAVEDELFSYWNENYTSFDELFKTIEGYHVLCSSKGYIIASLAHGPFPEKEVQVIAFAQTVENYLRNKGNYISDGLYIEEYSAILPGSKEHASEPLPLTMGRWIAGGVGVSVESFDRFSDVVSWIPKERLYKYIALTGIEVDSNMIPELKRLGDEPEPREKKKFSLIGRPELETFFEDNIIDIVNNSEQYKKMGIDFPGATILYGPPGCGKTYAVDRLTDYLDWPRFDIDASAIASPYIHETSKKIGEVFNSALKCAPSVIVIDEMEAFLSDRQASGTGIVTVSCPGCCNVDRLIVHQCVNSISYPFGKVIRSDSFNDQFRDSVFVQILQCIADSR